MSSEDFIPNRQLFCSFITGSQTSSFSPPTTQPTALWEKNKSSTLWLHVSVYWTMEYSVCLE